MTPAPLEAVAEEPEAEVDLEQLPLFEGHRVTETRLNFSGNILVDKATAEKMGLGKPITLKVTGRVVSATHRPTKDGQTLATDSRAVFVEGIELA